MPALKKVKVRATRFHNKINKFVRLETHVHQYENTKWNEELMHKSSNF